MIDMIPQSLSTANENILRVVIHGMPSPGGDTDLQRILDFRAGDQSRMAFLRLRKWMSNLAKNVPDPLHMLVELESALREYENSMRINRINVERSKAEIIVESALEIASDLLKFKWGSAAKAAFAIFKERTELATTELRAPGREVAYISRARSEFQ